MTKYFETMSSDSDSSWGIRLACLGGITGRVEDVKRNIVPVRGAVLVGTLAGIVAEPEGEWSYEWIELNGKANEHLLVKIASKPRISDNIAKGTRFSHAIAVNYRRYGQVSRLHCYFEVGAAGLQVVDIGSKNGTYYDDSRLASGLPCAVRDESVVRLGGAGNDSAQIKAYRKAMKICSLLVGVDYDDLGSGKIDKAISQVNALLRNMDAEYEARILKHSEVDNEKVMGALEDAARLPVESVFVFMFIAHGSQYDLWLSKKSTGIGKAELSAALNRIRAKKVVIIDSCHAGSGWERLERRAGLYFFSSAGDEVSYWGRFTEALVHQMSELTGYGPLDLKSVEMRAVARRVDPRQTPFMTGLKSIVFL
jgi:hypothetical protein